MSTVPSINSYFSTEEIAAHGAAAEDGADQLLAGQPLDPQLEGTALVMCYMMVGYATAKLDGHQEGRG